MATQNEIDLTYNWMDEFHRLRLGQVADISCAYFDGSNISLDEAQNRKHKWILDNLGFRRGDRILDIGSGWGPMLAEVRDQGGIGVGLTLSSKQAKSCADIGLDARLTDWKAADVMSLGKFDGIVSVGAFEHFCSIEEFRQGQQCSVYSKFFEFCSKLLKPGKSLYLQTMTWGKEVPNLDSITFDAPLDSDQRVLARLSKFYPGSWLPAGLDQIVTCANDRFIFLSANSGRMDYIRTLDEWGRASRCTMKHANSWPALVKVACEFLKDPDFRYKLVSVYLGDQQQCFIRFIMDHQRIFFRKPTTH